MSFNIKIYHKSIETIPKQLRCYICTEVVQNPLTCIKQCVLYCNKCFQIKNYCSYVFCHKKQTRKIGIVHQIHLREIQIQCSICSIFVVGLNYTKHIKQCYKTEQKKFKENLKKLILIGDQNSHELTQIKEIMECNEFKDQKFNQYSLRSAMKDNYSEQRIVERRLLILKCQLCQISFNFFDFDQHLSNCQEIQLDCDNKQCYWQGKRKYFNSHHLPCMQWKLDKLSTVRQTFATYLHYLNQIQAQNGFDRNQLQVDLTNFREAQIYPQEDFLTDSLSQNQRII
ncbi:hypothetical protein pb186bvf_019821 [Paramecium bursaria]